MPYYKKKPVVIEAKRLPIDSESPTITQYLDESIVIANWCLGSCYMMENDLHIRIETLEGTMRGEPGDWIIKGVQGEFYPCKPAIFEETYEKVS